MPTPGRIPTAVILTGGFYNTSRAKTAHGLIRHGKRYRIVAVIDPPMAGQDAGAFLGVRKSIPIVHDLEFSPPAENLIIGIAPSGGKLRPEWRKTISRALAKGMNVVSGLHDFLGDDPEFSRIASRTGAAIWDVRRPPAKLNCADGKLSVKCPIILTAGTDAACGKRTAAMTIVRLAERRGINVGFLATGQTGMMIGCDEGVVADRIPGDFISGEIEERLKWIAQKKKDMIVVEGNGALSHIAYGPVAHGILLGSHATHIVLCHDPSRTERISFPGITIPPIEEEIACYKQYSDATVAGVALITKGMDDWKEVIAEYRKRTGTVVVDPIRQGPGKILDAVMGTIKIGKIHGGFGKK
jgi:uncharacterized NAD-dependent epimerase/dehydratase family protein